MVTYLALTIGFIGSLHCIAMCGPIAFALPSVGKSLPSKLLSRLIYNSGRILTYGVLGLLFGLVGQGIKLAGFQQWLSIGVGIAILLLLVADISFIKKLNMFSPLYKAISYAKGTIIRLFSVHSYSSLFLIGLLNGLLPCGLVYIALTTSIATANAFQGALFMVVFGMGTLPLMFLAAFSGSLLNQNITRKFSRTIPVMMLVVSLMLIVRGMNLGIPYLSPKTDVAKNNFSKCCYLPQSKKS